MIRLELCIYYLLLVLTLVLVGCSSTPEVEVTPTNNVPLADTQSHSTSQNTPLTLTLSGTDPDGDTLRYAVTQQPSNGTLGAIDQASGEVIYTPMSGFSGKDTFTYTVSDNTTTSAEATVTISVTRSNTGPAATNQTLSTSENTPLTLTLTGNDPDGDALTFTIIQQPSLGQLGSIDQKTGGVLYTPTKGASGQDSFTFVVSDGTNISAEATITISIDNVNDAPTATPQTRSTPGNTALQLTLMGSDPENAELSFAIVASPSKGNLSDIDQTTGKVTYTPKQGESGEDSFSFTVSDGVNTSEPATVSITIGVVNRAPVAEDQMLETQEDKQLRVDLSASDEDGDRLTYTVIEDPKHGTLNADTLVYEPEENFYGQDSFTFRANDGKDDSNLATVTITVTPVNDAPVIVGLSNSTVAENQPPGTLVGVLSATDVDGDPLTYSIDETFYDFTMDGDRLLTTASFDYELSKSKRITVEVRDGKGTFSRDSKKFTIEILDKVGETYTVTNAEDSGPGSLRQVVAEANSDDMITFASNLYGQTITLTSGPITLSEDVAISGPGYSALTVSGGGTSQVFVVEEGNRVVLENLTLTNGYGELGGAIYTKGALILQGDLRITDSDAMQGGGVYVDNSENGALYLRDDVLITNNTAYRGGGILNRYGGLTLTNNASVSNNTARAEGGGIYNYSFTSSVSPNQTLYLDDYASVTNNQALNGGGIYNRGETQLRDYANITENTAQQMGGGVMNHNGDVVLHLRGNASITGNTADLGGGLYNPGGSLTMRSETRISDNSAREGLGGGIYDQGGSFSSEVGVGFTVVANKPDNIHRE